MPEVTTTRPRRAKFLKTFDTWTSLLARAIAIGGFLVLAYSTTSPVLREWLAGSVTESETFSAALDETIAPLWQHMTTVQQGVVSRAGGPISTGTGERWVTDRVEFDTPFESTPVVSVGISFLDAAGDRTVRVRVYAIDINDSGFTYKIGTWLNSINYGVEVNWIAVGPLPRPE